MLLLKATITYHKRKTRDDDTEDISKFPMLHEGLEGHERHAGLEGLEGLDISC